MEDKKSGMENREKLIREAYDKYVKEGREEADRLFDQGCMVNYREFSYEDFVEVGSNPEHRWRFLFPEEYRELFNTFKDE
jgi:hypothetical protein